MNSKIQVCWEGPKQLLILYYIYVPHGQFQVLARCSTLEYLYESCFVRMFTTKVPQSSLSIEPFFKLATIEPLTRVLPKTPRKRLINHRSLFVTTTRLISCGGERCTCSLIEIIRKLYSISLPCKIWRKDKEVTSRLYAFRVPTYCTCLIPPPPTEATCQASDCYYLLDAVYFVRICSISICDCSLQSTCQEVSFPRLRPVTSSTSMALSQWLLVVDRVSTRT
jgi:hypothetical protein